MKGPQALAGLSILLAAMAFPAAVGAWEVRLRAEVTTQAALVRLGDVAEVAGGDLPAGDALDQIVIALGPTRTRSRELTQSDVRKTLAGHGVDMRQCQFTGASRVVVTFGCAQASAAPASRGTSGSASRLSPQWQAMGSAQQRLEDLVTQQLQQAAGDGRPWKAEVKLTGPVPEQLMQASSRVTIEALGEASEGTHQLVACVSDGRESARVPFEARTHRLVAAVVPVRDLARGELVQARDVELKYVESVSEPGAGVERLEDAVGHQMRQNASADQPLSARSLQPPLLVRKRDEVEVWVRCGGIQARRRAVALSDGARGDLITVDTNDGSRTRFNARVIDIRQVEVLPNSTSTGQ